MAAVAAWQRLALRSCHPMGRRRPRQRAGLAASCSTARASPWSASLQMPLRPSRRCAPSSRHSVSLVGRAPSAAVLLVHVRALYVNTLLQVVFLVLLLFPLLVITVLRVILILNMNFVLMTIFAVMPFIALHVILIPKLSLVLMIISALMPFIGPRTILMPKMSLIVNILSALMPFFALRVILIPKMSLVMKIFFALVSFIALCVIHMPKMSLVLMILSARMPFIAPCMILMPMLSLPVLRALVKMHPPTLPGPLPSCMSSAAAHLRAPSRNPCSGCAWRYSRPYLMKPTTMPCLGSWTTDVWWSRSMGGCIRPIACGYC
mmetsp:Transcript_24911/g.51792  ORF Transcript_24911/g.51792 Transcript_24911/m.51792 type:complete len:320 (+) Transcript_24911:116-1075(+)